MKVLYDGAGFVVPHSGVARYFTEVMRRLPSDMCWQLAIKSTSNEYLKKPPFSIPAHKLDLATFIQQTLNGHSFRGVSYFYKVLAHLFPQKFPAGEVDNARMQSNVFKECDFDVLHLTAAHPVHAYWRTVVGRRPLVVTVYDLIPEILYKSKRVARCRQRLLQDATKIIAISEYTKKDLLRLYDVDPKKISVIYLGYLPMLGAGVPGGRFCDKPYILYVGKRSGYKNFTTFVRAVAPLINERDMKVYCTSVPFSAEELALFDSLNVRNRFEQHYVSDEDLPSLFSQAALFVYPSKYEGFGIPILDAFAASCPVVLANASCFPEVGGDAALYFDPDDVEDMRRKMRQVIDNPDLREKMVARGLCRVKEFSWDACAKKTSEIYREAIKQVQMNK